MKKDTTKAIESKTEKMTPITQHLPSDLLAEIDQVAKANYEGNRQMAVRQLLREALQARAKKH